MSVLERRFAAAFNWCDYRCERCPLASTCPLSVRDERRRWALETRGIDPHAPETVLGEVAGAAALALRHLREASTESPGAPPPASLERERIRRRGWDVVAALAGETLEAPASSALDEAFALASLLAAKAARVSTFVGAEAEESWEIDTAPNLLLIERLLPELQRALEAALDAGAAARVGSRAAEFRRTLAFELECLDARHRRELEEWVRNGEAPSPFVTIEDAAWPHEEAS